jgi:hypothetical protein
MGMGLLQGGNKVTYILIATIIIESLAFAFFYASTKDLENLLFDEIERLRKERDAIITKLKNERDEARRDLCDLYVKGQPSSSNMTDKDYAAELGWDCFKEDGK